MEAVAALVDIPASAEQIALARIEGRTALSQYANPTRDYVKGIHNLARRALGLPT